MSRFREEVGRIPGLAWVIGMVLYVGLATVLYLAFEQEPNPPEWLFSTLFEVLIPLPLLVYVLLVGYINADARRRGMRYVMWTLLAAFIPNGIGIILYFILRDPLMVACPACGVVQHSGFAFCVACGAAIRPACPQCRHAVEAKWSNCPHCGAKLWQPAK